MRILVSNEFYELFRGEKDFLIPRLLARSGRHRVFILCPTELSPFDRQSGYAFAPELFVERLGLGPDAVRFHSPWLRIRKTHNKKIHYLIPRLSYLLQLWRIRPDAIVESIYTTLTPRSFVNWLYCALLRKPRILLDAGDEGRNPRRLPFERQAVRSARKIFTYSPGGVKRIADKYGIADPGRFFIHLKLLDTDRFRFRGEFARPAFTVGYVGRFVRAKGFDRFLDLVAACSDPAVRFLAVGPNVENFELPARVERREYVENSRLAEIYSALDLLVLPDMRDYRGYSTVAQEALMCGAEVALGCLDRSFYPREDGVFFFDPDRPEDLAAHIVRRAARPPADRRAARQALSDEYRRAADGSGFLAELEKQMEGPA